MTGELGRPMLVDNSLTVYGLPAAATNDELFYHVMTIKTD